MIKLPDDVVYALARLKSTIAQCNRLNYCAGAIHELEQAIRLNATSHPVSDGCKVPNEPTPEMQTAGAKAIRFDTTPVNKLFTANAVYRAMLEAAPGGQDD